MLHQAHNRTHYASVNKSHAAPATCVCNQLVKEKPEHWPLAVVVDTSPFTFLLGNGEGTEIKFLEIYKGDPRHMLQTLTL